MSDFSLCSIIRPDPGPEPETNSHDYFLIGCKKFPSCLLTEGVQRWDTDDSASHECWIKKWNTGLHHQNHWRSVGSGNFIIMETEKKKKKKKGTLTVFLHPDHLRPGPDQTLQNQTSHSHETRSTIRTTWTGWTSTPTRTRCCLSGVQMCAAVLVLQLLRYSLHQCNICLSAWRLTMMELRMFHTKKKRCSASVFITTPN